MDRAKVYKTKGNLELVWWQLDEALGHIDNATYNLSLMSGLSERAKDVMERIDVGHLIELRDEVGKLLEEKEKNSDTTEKEKKRWNGHEVVEYGVVFLLDGGDYEIIGKIEKERELMEVKLRPFVLKYEEELKNGKEIWVACLMDNSTYQADWKAFCVKVDGENQFDYDLADYDDCVRFNNIVNGDTAKPIYFDF